MTIPQRLPQMVLGLAIISLLALPAALASGTCIQECKNSCSAQCDMNNYDTAPMGLDREMPGNAERCNNRCVKSCVQSCQTGQNPNAAPSLGGSLPETKPVRMQAKPYPGS